MATLSLSRDEVREIDEYAIRTLGIPGVILMENAGRQCADAAESMLRGSHGRSAAIVAGAGNNGGDGYVVARHLDLRGVDATVFLLTPRDKIRGDADINLRIIEQLGLEIHHFDEAEIATLSSRLAPFDLIIDAIGGTGISGALRGATAVAVEQVNAAGKSVLAVDIPTGLDCDSGQAPGPAIKADLTVTFVALKRGFAQPGASNFTGEVRVADIGIPAQRVAGFLQRNGGTGF